MMSADDDAAEAEGPGPEQAESRPSAAAKRPAQPESAGDIQNYIGARLRQAFDDVAKQPVPDRFLQLMRELDKS